MASTLHVAEGAVRSAACELSAVPDRSVVLAADHEHRLAPRPDEVRKVRSAVEHAHAPHDVIDVLVEGDPAASLNRIGISVRGEEGLPVFVPSLGHALLVEKPDGGIPKLGFRTVGGLGADEDDQAHPIRCKPGHLEGA